MMTDNPNSDLARYAGECLKLSCTKQALWALKQIERNRHGHVTEAVAEPLVKGLHGMMIEHTPWSDIDIEAVDMTVELIATSPNPAEHLLKQGEHPNVYTRHLTDHTPRDNGRLYAEMLAGMRS
jgi:hypothetical protein